MFDSLQRYIFEEADVRGEIVQLSDSYQQMLARHNYPPAVANLLGQAYAATALLTATLKFSGEINLQLQGNGPVRLITINGRDNLELRGVARYEGEIADDASLQQMMGKGFVVITLTPDEGERYQGVVGLEKDSLAVCLEEYFAQSEQLETHLWLHADAKQGKAAGLFLQRLPASDKAEAELEHLVTLTETMSAEELFTLDSETVLTRLYHQEKVRLYEPQAIGFVCGCSKAKCSNALVSIGRDEAEAIMDEQGQIEMTCEYCLSTYAFAKGDLDEVFGTTPSH